VAFLAPILLILGLLLMGDVAPEAASVPKGKGTVEVAFTTSLSTTNGAPVLQAFQRVLLNVIAVRLNPSTDSAVSDGDPNWQEIAVPAGVGKSNVAGEISTGLTFGGNFGPNGAIIAFGQGRAEIQLDMLALLNLPQIFNSGVIKAQTYHQIELVLDPNIPGNIIPLCGSGSPTAEGCVVYPAQLDPSTVQPIRASTSYDVTSQTVQPLVVQINTVVGPAPVLASNTNKASVLINPSIAVPPNNAASGDVVTNSALGTVRGSIALPLPSNKVTVTAEVSGTNQIVASTPVLSNGNFSMALPASASGTLYDFYTSGTRTSFIVRSQQTVTQGGILDLGKLTVPARSTFGLSGKVMDACSGVAIQAATLDMLVADTTFPGGAPDCNADPTPAGCVVAASATTDDAGHFPMPGSSVQQAPFQILPSLPSGQNYALRISASGYNGWLQKVTSSGGVFKCVGSGSTNDACNFSLEHGEIDVTAALAAPNSEPALNVLIMPEDHGSNSIEGLGMATIPNGQASSGQVAVLVPDSTATLPATNRVASYDLFASTQDVFGGSPQKATGHTLAVASNIPAPGKCENAGSTPAAPTAVLSGLRCGGHSSISGNVTNADQNTAVVLADSGVQVQNAAVAGVNTYSFCAPTDPTASYTVEHFERQPDGSLLPAPGAVPVAASFPAPVATSTPCSSICNTGTPNTCFVCTGALAPSIP
jgi:hypothetical protein